MWMCVQEFYEKHHEYVAEKKKRNKYRGRLQLAQDRLAPIEKELAEGRDKVHSCDDEYAAKVSKWCTTSTSTM